MFFSGLELDSLMERRARRLEWARETLTVVKQGAGVVPFEPFDVQEEAWLGRTGRDLYLKQREVGMSAGIIGAQFTDFVFDGGSSLIAANKEKTVIGLFRDYVLRYVRDTQERWPSALPPVLNKTQTGIIFEDGRGVAYKAIEGFGASSDFGSGFRFYRAILDEFAKWPVELAEQMYWSILGTLVKGAETAIPFTPFGMGGLAPDLWFNAKERGYVRHNYTLYAIHGRGLIGNPDHDLEWWRDQCKEYGPVGVAQEYLGDFIQSGRPWIDADCLPEPHAPLGDTEIHKSLVGIPGLDLWDEPRQSHRIVSFTDTAEGLAHGDYNVTTGWDANTGRQIYQLRDKLPPEVHAANHHAVTIIYRNGRHYYEINNTSGGAYGAACKQLGTAGVVEHRTTATTRPDMEKEANRQLRLAEIHPASAALLDECRIVCYDDKGKVQAPSGYHDDAWMSMCGAAYYMARSGGSCEGFGAVGTMEAGGLI